MPRLLKGTNVRSEGIEVLLLFGAIGVSMDEGIGIRLSQAPDSVGISLTHRSRMILLCLVISMGEGEKGGSNLHLSKWLLVGILADEDLRSHHLLRGVQDFFSFLLHIAARLLQNWFSLRLIPLLPFIRRYVGREHIFCKFI